MADSFKVLCDSTDREAWLEARRQGIGASDMAAVLGVSTWGSPLSVYAEKRGVVPLEDKEEEWQFWGKRLEPVILEHFALQTGRNVRFAGKLLQSLEHPWALATLDGEQIFDAIRSEESIGQWCPVEVKNLRYPPDGIPLQYRVQLNQQMLVTGTDRASFCLLATGSAFYMADVEREEGIIKTIIETGEIFWEMVKNGTPPRPDGHRATAKALNALHPKDNHETVVLDGECFDIADELEYLAKENRSIQTDMDKLKNQVKAAIGDASYGVLADGRQFSWKANKNGVRSLRIPKREE